MKSPIVKFGVIGGTVVSVLFLGPFLIFSDMYTNPDSMAWGEVVGYSTMILSMLAVHFGIRQYRNEFFPASFSFVKGLGTGVLITLVATAVFYLGNVLLYEVLMPNLLTDFAEPYKEHLMQSATSEIEKEQIIEEFEKNSAILENSYLYALLMAVTVFFIGLVISLVSALILKRR